MRPHAERPLALVRTGGRRGYWAVLLTANLGSRPTQQIADRISGLSTSPILFVTATLEPAGGTSQALVLARSLLRDGQRVYWMSLSGEGPLANRITDQGIRLHVAGIRGPFDLPALVRARALIRAAGPAIVHAWDGPSAGWARVLAGRKTQIVATLRRPVAPRAPLAGNWVKRLARRGTIVVPSESLRADLAASCGRRAKIHLVPDGVPPASLVDAPNQDSNVAARLAALGIPAGSRLMGTACRLTAAANLKDAIWATDLLQVARGDVHLLVFGDGPAPGQFQRFAQFCNVGPRVHFLSWRTDLSQWLPHLHVLWQPGPRAGPSLVVLEAQAAGVPVIACDCPGHRECIENGKSGYLVAAGDRANLARAALRVLENPQLAAQIGREGKERVRREHSLSEMIDGYRQVYASGA